MIKNFTRIIVGLGLLAAAYWLHYKAIDITERASGAPLKIGEELPPGHADMFFGEDPSIVVTRPENQARLATARTVEKAAGLSALTSGFLLLLGTAPFVSSLLGWLFIPDFIRDRARLAQKRPDEQLPDHPEPEQEQPCDTAAQS